MLKNFWEKKERFWVTFDKEDAKSTLVGEKVYSCHYPTNRNAKAFVKNTLLAWRILRLEAPDVIISTGAAIAVPFFYLGKILGSKLVYIEIFDRIKKPTLTGRLVYPIADAFVVQWEEMLKACPRAVYLGSVF
jgi:UDP-N-acetylglucosamine:LPS N-acetylglucosamine transferase